MKELLLILLGAAGAVIAFLFSKSVKPKQIEAGDSKEALAAVERAAELMGRRALVEAKTVEARIRVEEKLLIPDPKKRLEAIAEELKDL